MRDQASSVYVDWTGTAFGPCFFIFFCFVFYLSMLHYNQATLVENRDSFCTATPNNSAGLILHQHSEGAFFSQTHVLFCEEMKSTQQLQAAHKQPVLTQTLFSDFFISYLD